MVLRTLLHGMVRRGIETATAMEIMVLVEHYGLGISLDLIDVKQIHACKLLDGGRVSEVLNGLKLHLEEERLHIPFAALVGLLRRVRVRRAMPEAPLPGLWMWMRVQEGFADMAASYEQHRVLGIAASCLSDEIVARVTGQSLDRVRDVRCGYEKARAAAGLANAWTRTVLV